MRKYPAQIVFRQSSAHLGRGRYRHTWNGVLLNRAETLDARADGLPVENMICRVTHENDSPVPDVARARGESWFHVTWQGRFLPGRRHFDYPTLTAAQDRAVQLVAGRYYIPGGE